MRYLAAVATLLLTACATTPDVRTDFDPATNFSTYRTYSWVFTQIPEGMNPFVFQRVHDSIDRALQARGYTQTDAGDFAVAFTLGSRDKVRVSDYGPYGGFYPGWGWGWSWGGWWPQYRSIDVRNVTEGTLALDFYDARTRRPIWHADASKEITPGHINQKELDADIDTVIGRFPPQSSTGYKPRTL
jgi:hypothetical protein